MAESTGELVHRCYALFNAGDVHAARECWSEDAVWHGENHRSTTVTGDHDRSWYFDTMARLYQEHPGYAPEIVSELELGPQLFCVYMRSRNGEAPHEVEGLMLWRVIDGKIVECWAIPGDSRLPYAF